ncbi:MAG: hypothetical protein JWM36_1156 [Hyphomicrobiales bacterium]|nr:hypothetical protein [Hyphomicrobiales bacterium]
MARERKANFGGKVYAPLGEPARVEVRAELRTDPRPVMQPAATLVEDESEEPALIIRNWFYVGIWLIPIMLFVVGFSKGMGPNPLQNGFFWFCMAAFPYCVWACYREYAGTRFYDERFEYPKRIADSFMIWGWGTVPYQAIDEISSQRINGGGKNLLSGGYFVFVSSDLGMDRVMFCDKLRRDWFLSSLRSCAPDAKIWRWS